MSEVRSRTSWSASSKSGGGGGSDGRGDDETVVQSALTNLRAGLFGASFAINSGDNPVSSRAAMFFDIIEFMQMASFPLSLLADSRGVGPLASATGSLTTQAIEHFAATYSFIVTICIAGCIVLLLTVLTVWVGLRAAVDAQQSRLMLRSLRGLAQLSSSALLIPVAGTLAASFHCSNDLSLGTGYWMGTSLVCGSAGHIVLAVFMAALLALYASLSTFFAVTCFEPDPASASWGARVHGRVDMAVIVIKLGLTLVWSFSSELSPYGSSGVVLPAAGLLVACGCLWMCLVWIFAPAIRMRRNAGAIAVASMFTWLSLLILAHATFRDSIEVSLAVILGTPIAGMAAAAAFLLRVEAVVKLNLSDVKHSVVTLDLWARLQLRRILQNTSFSAFKHSQDTSKSGGDGSIDSISRLIQAWKRSLDGDGATVQTMTGPANSVPGGGGHAGSVLERRTVHSHSTLEDSANDEEDSALLSGAVDAATRERLEAAAAFDAASQAAAAYNHLTTAFPTSELALMLSAAFRQVWSPFQYGELLSLYRASLLHPSLDVRFRIYLRTKQLRQNKKNGPDGAVGTVVDRVLVEKHMHEIAQLRRSAYRVSGKLWENLAAQVVDLGQVASHGERLQRELTQLEALYKKVLRADPNSTAMLRGYAAFLREQRHADLAGLELDNKADRIEEAQLRRRSRHIRQVVYGMRHHSQLDQSDGSSAVVVISGEPANLGEIVQVSLGACRLLNYRNAQQLIGTNVDELVPEPIRSHHDSYLRRFGSRLTSNRIGKAQCIFACTSTGTLVPCWMQVEEAPPDARTSSPRFTAVLEPITTTEQHLLCGMVEDNYQIHGGTSGSLDLIDLSPDSLKGEDGEASALTSYFPTIAHDCGEFRLVVTAHGLQLCPVGLQADEGGDGEGGAGAAAAGGAEGTRSRSGSSTVVASNSQAAVQLLSLAQAASEAGRTTLPGTNNELVDVTERRAVISIKPASASGSQATLLPVVTQTSGREKDLRIVVGCLQSVRSAGLRFHALRWRSADSLVRRGRQKEAAAATSTKSEGSPAAFGDQHNARKGHERSERVTVSSRVLAVRRHMSNLSPEDLAAVQVVDGNDPQLLIGEQPELAMQQHPSMAGSSIDEAGAVEEKEEEEDEDEEAAGLGASSLGRSSSHAAGSDDGSGDAGGEEEEEEEESAEKVGLVQEGGSAAQAPAPANSAVVVVGGPSPAMPRGRVSFASGRGSRTRKPPGLSPLVNTSVRSVTRSPGPSQRSPASATVKQLQPQNSTTNRSMVSAGSGSKAWDRGSKGSASTGSTGSAASTRLISTLRTTAQTRDGDVWRVQSVMLIVTILVVLIGAGDLWWLHATNAKVDLLLSGLRRSGERVVTVQQTSATIFDIVAAHAGLRSDIVPSIEVSSARLGVLAQELQDLHEEVYVNGADYGVETNLYERKRPFLINELSSAIMDQRLADSLNGTMTTLPADRDIAAAPCKNLTHCDAHALSFISRASLDFWLEGDEVLQANALNPDWRADNASERIPTLVQAYDIADLNLQRDYLRSLPVVAETFPMPLSQFGEYFVSMLQRIANVDNDELGYRNRDVRNALGNDQTFLRGCNVTLQMRAKELTQLLPQVQRQLVLIGSLCFLAIFLLQTWLVALFIGRLARRTRTILRLMLLVPRKTCRQTARTAHARWSEMGEDSGGSVSEPDSEEEAGKQEEPVAQRVDSLTLNERLMEAGLTAHNQRTAKTPSPLGRAAVPAPFSQAPPSDDEEEEERDFGERPDHLGPNRTRRGAVAGSMGSRGSGNKRRSARSHTAQLHVVKLRPHSDSSRYILTNNLRFAAPTGLIVCWLGYLFGNQLLIQQRLQDLAERTVLTSMLSQSAYGYMIDLTQAALSSDPANRYDARLRVRQGDGEMLNLAEVGMFGGDLELAGIQEIVTVSPLDRTGEAFQVYVNDGCSGSSDYDSCIAVANGALAEGAYSGVLGLVALGRKLVSGLPRTEYDPQVPLVYGTAMPVWRGLESVSKLVAPHLKDSFQRMSRILASSMRKELDILWSYSLWGTVVFAVLYAIVTALGYSAANRLSVPLNSARALLVQIPGVVRRRVPAVRQAMKDVIDEPGMRLVNVQFDPKTAQLVKAGAKRTK